MLLPILGRVFDKIQRNIHERLRDNLYHPWFYCDSKIFWSYIKVNILRLYVYLSLSELSCILLKNKKTTYKPINWLESQKKKLNKPKNILKFIESILRKLVVCMCTIDRTSNKVCTLKEAHIKRRAPLNFLLVYFPCKYSTGSAQKVFCGFW